MLAVVFGCERFHTYVYGKQFTIQYDHKPLEMIQLKNLAAAPPPSVYRGCYSASTVRHRRQVQARQGGDVS